MISSTPTLPRTKAAATGKPWAEPIPFTTDQPVPSGLVFVLVAGSDARPGEDLLHTRADSLHLLCVNPATGQGTLLGFPRDSWVEIPGHGRVADLLAGLPPGEVDGVRRREELL